MSDHQRQAALLHFKKVRGREPTQDELSLLDYPDVDGWQLPPQDPTEVICHGDVGPYNAVLREGRIVALIDFDTAHPDRARGTWPMPRTASRR